MGITFRITDTNFTLLDENQWYPARLLDVQPDELTWQGKPVAKFKFNFVLLDPEEFEGREVHGMVNQPDNNELNERHTLYQWITALRGGRPLSIGDDIDFPDEFMGRIVLIQVKGTKKDYDGKQMTFQNVKKLAVCPEGDEFKNRAPDKMPVGMESETQETPDAPEETPDTPAPEPTPTPEPEPEPKVEETPDPSGPASEGSSTVMLDGEEIEVPF